MARSDRRKSGTPVRTRREAKGSSRKAGRLDRTAAGQDGPRVVGIGASAGGLEALKSFFGSMPRESGMAFAVVVHLDPTHESLLAELLVRCTPLTVEVARDRQRMEADHVYVIPPNRTLTIERGLLRVREPSDRRALRGAIDHFFRSLAVDQADRAVAIVLSGSGTEGTLGARAIEGEGGMVMAQAPETASQPSMPASVIATGLVSHVLAPDKMPEALLAHIAGPRVRATPAGAAPPATTANGLAGILALLHARTKYDFRGYKGGTLHRRIERRMGLLHIDSVARYAAYLRSHPSEMDRLFKDLLIGVTSFFRDPLAFEELAAKVLAGLVKERGRDGAIRVWVPACSTGEEAYSIAIVIAEQIAKARSACQVQIFATDVDEHALDVARSGIYSDGVALDVTPARLRRFFTREDHRYTIAKSIRQSVTFAVQNVLTDPPFAKMDLVSCRNVMIYFESEPQERLLDLFHFALVPGGHLFLGSADGVGSRDGLFAPVSKRHRIFRRLESVKHPGLRLSPALLHASAAARVTPKPSVEPALGAAADRELLDHFAPAAVVVRRTGEVLRFYGAMERFIRHPSGEATHDVFALAREALKPLMRAALHDAVRKNRQCVHEGLEFKRDGRPITLRITVRPLRGILTAEALWLMIFEELPLAPSAARSSGAGKPVALARRLEAELRATKKEQRQLVEQLETGNEELTAANEEILSVNEELQSTNQELTTSKEELQSLNEELTTLNAQLHYKMREVTAVNDDLANLLVSTDIATVFVDTEFRIKRFTKAATHLLNLLPTDIGRPLNHLATNLVVADLSQDARTVMAALTPIEKEVNAKDGSRYILRVFPYRTEDRTIGGVVLTLVDVTALKKTEHELRAARERLSSELRRMVRLHEATTALVESDDVSDMLRGILEAAIEVTGADMGNVQLLHEPANRLTIAAHHGFERPFLDFFHEVPTRTDSACAQALDTHQRVVVEDVDTSPLFRDAPSLPVLRAAGVRTLQCTPLLTRSGRFVGVLSTHFRAPRTFGDSELRWLDLLTRHAAELVARRQAEVLLVEAHGELEQRVTERTQWLTLMHDVIRAINDAPSWDEGLQQVLQRICATGHWQIGYVYLPDRDDPDVIVAAISCLGDERFRPFHAATAGRRFTRGQNLPANAYADGQAVWVNGAEALAAVLSLRGEAAREVGLQAAAAVPVRFGHDIIAVLELFSDQPHPPNDLLETLMNDVSAQIGKVLERERSAAQVADLVWREQQSLLHTLHDSLGQTLTGLGMLSSGLGQQVAGMNPAAAETARQVARQSQVALDQVRQLSRGLFPVEVDSQSLLPALRELAATTETFHGIGVQVTGEAPGSIRDAWVATHLYRIAQEAVTNAVKHARPRTISVELTESAGVVKLRIIDDGTGIGKPLARDNGLGLRIMRYRATSIGAQFSIEARPEGGTAVVCTLREPPPLQG